MVWHLAAAQFSHFISFYGQQSTSFIELLSSSAALTASRRYHVKLLWEQLMLHSIPPLQFLTSGDTIAVDLSSPIMEEVSHFSTSGCQPSLMSLYFSLKLALLWGIKLWHIEQHRSQAVASLTTLQTTLDIWYSPLFLIVSDCVALGGEEEKRSFWLLRCKNTLNQLHCC